MNKWYFDELYRRARSSARRRRRALGLERFERVVIDGLVNGTVSACARGLGGRARGAERLPALLRRAAAARPCPRRPLVPPAEHVADGALLPPLGSPVLRARSARCSAAAWRRRWRCSARRSRSAWRSRYIADFDTGKAGAPARHRHGVDRCAGHPLQARRRRPEPVPAHADDAAVVRGHAVRVLPPVGPPAALLLLLGPGRVGRAGRVPVPGPRPVRGLLRPDARALLLPHRDLGRAQARPGHDQARHLHPRGVAAHARRGDRHRGRVGGQQRPDQLRALRPRARRPAHRHAGVDLPALRRGLPGQDARLPGARVAARRLPGHADPGGRGVQRRALQGGRVRVHPHRAAAVPPGRACTSRSCCC